MVGAYVLGTAADYIGRRKALIISVVILTVGALLTAFSWDVVSLAIFRALTGIGMGAQIALAGTVMTEMAPTRLRGKGVSYNVVAGGLGLAVAPFIGILLLGTGADGWRFVLGLGALSVILLPFMTDRWFPESPRWLVLHGQENRARAIIAQMEEHARRASGQELPPVREEPSEHTMEHFPTAELLRRPYVGRLAVVLLFWIFHYMAAYAYLAFAPTILIKMGLSQPSGLLYSALGDLMFPVGALVAAFVADRWQRKNLVALAELIGIVGIAVLALAHSPLALVVGGLVAGFWILFSVSFAYPYTAEVFPTRARASAMSIGDGLGHLGGAIQPYIVVAALASIGARGTWWVIAAMLAVALALIFFGGLPTKDEGLTEIAQ